MKLRTERNVDKERNASTALVKNCDGATEFYEHVNIICTHLIKWLKEDAAKAAASAESEDVQKLIDLMQQALHILEKQLENLFNHDLAHQLDIKDAFTHYKELLRQQFVAVIGLDRAQLNNAAALWKQDLIEASNTVSTAMTTSNMFFQGQSVAHTMAVETHVGTLNREILNLNTKVFNMQTELQKSYTTISNLTCELSNKTTRLSQDSKKLEQTEAQKRKTLEDSRRTAGAVAFAEAKIKVLEKKLDSSDEHAEELKVQLQSRDDKIEEFEADLASQNTTITNLEEKLDIAKNKTKEFEAELASKVKKINEMQAERNSDHDKIKELKVESASKDSKTKELEAELESLEVQVKDLKARVTVSDDKFVKCNAEFDKKIADIEKTNAELQKTITALQKAIADSQKNATLQTTNADIRSKNAELREEVNPVDIKKQLHETLNSRTVKQLQGKVEDLEAQLESASVQTTELYSRLAYSYDKNTEQEMKFHEQLTELQKQLKVCEQKNKQLQEALESKEEMIKQLEQNLKSAEAQVAEKAIKAAELQEIVDENKKKLEQLPVGAAATEKTVAMEDIKDKDGTIDTLRKSTAEQGRKMELMRKKISDMHDFIDERDEKIMELKSRTVSLEITVADKDKVIEALRLNVAPASAVAVENEDKMMKLRGLYASLHREFAAKVAELDYYKKKATEAEEIAGTLSGSGKGRMVNLRKHNEELVKSMENMTNENGIYRALVEQDVQFLNDNRINGTLFEAGLHRNAPKNGYVSQG